MSSSLAAAVVLDSDDASNRSPLILQPGFNQQSRSENSVAKDSEIQQNQYTNRPVLLQPNPNEGARRRPVMTQRRFDEFCVNTNENLPHVAGNVNESTECTGFQQIQSQLITQQRDQLAALLMKQSAEERKVKQSTVLGRLFGKALEAEKEESDDLGNRQLKEKSDLGSKPTRNSRQLQANTPVDISDGRLIARVKTNAGVDDYLKLVDENVSDVSSPETPQPTKGSAQDLTWDEMADCAENERVESKSVERGDGFDQFSSTLSQVDAEQLVDRNSRLLAVIKGELGSFFIWFFFF